MKQMLKRACMGVVLLILTLTMAACSTETIEPATSKFSTGSDDANTIPTDDLETSLLPNEAFENVLLNQRQFFYTNSNSNPIYQSDVYLSEIAGEDQSTMSLSKFAVVMYDDELKNSPVTENEREDLLTECILKLPEQQRMVIWMKYKQGYSLREIAKALDISLVWAQKIDQRAKKKLEELYLEGGGIL